MLKELKKLKKFILNDLTERYEEIMEHIPTTALFKPENVLLFINDYRKTVWIWIGSYANPKQRFLGTLKAPEVLIYHYAFLYTIKTAEQNDEPLAFRKMVGGDITPDEVIIEEIRIEQNDDGIDIMDNRGNSIFISKENLSKFKKQIEELK